ncbi:hypothetical protein DY000_02008390 [Brassica cretica]|uniref:Uncharacterized protein n=1 Tax=Brassica cretica TaxID=69181 RepID=A0ABQ7C374_BRACR|nr:hypothetical protein DY000_02008390 [Brassica cretica]
MRSEGSRAADMPAIATEYSRVMKWPSYRASADLFEEKEEETDEKNGQHKCLRLLRSH